MKSDAFMTVYENLTERLLPPRILNRKYLQAPRSHNPINPFGEISSQYIFLHFLANPLIFMKCFSLVQVISYKLANVMYVYSIRLKHFIDIFHSLWPSNKLLPDWLERLP